MNVYTDDSYEYVDALNGISLDKLKKICAKSLCAVTNNRTDSNRFHIICDICHKLECGDIDDKEYSSIVCKHCEISGLCEDCGPYEKLSEYICQQCPKKLCGICQKSLYTYFDHIECMKTIRPLLNLPNEICTKIIDILYNDDQTTS